MVGLETVPDTSWTLEKKDLSYKSQGRKKRIGFNVPFNSVKSYNDEIENRNREEIVFSSRIIPRGSFSCRRTIGSPPQCAHSFSDQTNSLGESGFVTTRPRGIPL